MNLTGSTAHVLGLRKCDVLVMKLCNIYKSLLKHVCRTEGRSLSNIIVYNFAIYFSYCLIHECLILCRVFLFVMNLIDSTVYTCWA